MSEVLERYPELLEVLIEASPAFARLKNPLLRRTMPRLVSVAQAARIGGIEPAALVERLNRALGIEPPREAEAPPDESLLGTPSPAWLERPIGFRLDVRPILAAAQEVPEGKRLILEAPFEPIPLYRVMQKKGFAAWCEQVGPEHYRVHFLRQAGSQAAPQALRPFSEADWADWAAEVYIEANLEPPCP